HTTGQSRYLSARHQPDARAGAGELCHARNSAVLAATLIHRAGRSGRPRRRGLPAAIPTTVVAAVPAHGYGPAGGFGKPAVFSFRRCAEDGPDRNHRGPFVVRLVEIHRGHGQIGTHATGYGGVDSGAGRRADRICCVVVPRGRLVTRICVLNSALRW